jgi:hypothetical protein
MKTTIAVALITAISTLSAAAISGYLAYKVSAAQGKQAWVEQRLLERRQIRRQAYVQFLNQVGIAEQALDKLWQSKTPSEPDFHTFIESGIDATGAVQPLLYLVTLEGPSAVVSAAAFVTASLMQECREITRITAKGETSTVICVQDEEAFTRAAYTRKDAKIKMIMAAQASLKSEKLNDPFDLSAD